MQAVSQLVTLVVLAVLFRLLGPEPYGLLAMVVPLLFLLRILLAGGLDVAAIQKAELTPPQVSALFWLNQILGLATALLALAAAPALAWFFGQPRLIPLTAALAGTSLVVALGTQHQALLQRKMQLGRLSVIRVVAQTAGGAAGIAAALAGSGVWALVIQQYIEFFTLSALAWLIEPWRPQLVLFRTGTRGMLRFGGHYTLSGLMFHLTTSIDKILVGYALGEQALGLYSQAFNLMMKPVQVFITPLSGLMLPALARATPEREHYAALASSFFRAIALVMLPAGVGLILVANEAMRVLGGPQWAAAGPLLAALAAAVLVQGFFNVLGSVLASVGRADRLFRASVATALVMSGGFAVGLQVGRWMGNPVLGVAEAYSATLLLIVFPPYLTYCLHTVGLSWGHWLRAIRPGLRPALGMGLAVGACHWLLGRVAMVSDFTLLTTEIALGVAVYTLLARRQLRRYLALLMGAEQP